MSLSNALQPESPPRLAGCSPEHLPPARARPTPPEQTNPKPLSVIFAYSRAPWAPPTSAVLGTIN